MPDSLRNAAGVGIESFFRTGFRGADMTDQITVPKQTWDALREALERLKIEVVLSDISSEYIESHFRSHLDIATAALTAANAVSEPQPAGPEDMAIYKSIADGYFNAMQSQGEASEVSATLAQFGKDGTKDWPEWIKAAAHTATASFPVRSKEKREFDIRGALAAKLTCWHRMSEADSDALVALFAAHPQATEPAGYKLVPVEPSRQQLMHGWTAISGKLDHPNLAHLYRAMLAAAPEAP